MNRENYLLHNNTYCVIMAGGIGSRFWPLSRQDTPKQFLDILGTGHTMIQDTIFRFEAVAPARNFIVLTAEAYEVEMLKQVPALRPSQILTEPVRRNTAPAIAYAAYKIFSSDPNATMIVAPSDHYIGEEHLFRRTIAEALEYVSKHHQLLTIGIEPTYPSTAYGYIEMQDPSQAVGQVVRFKEKPQRPEAEQLVASGNYLWNSGMFVWKVRDIVDALEKYLPEVAVHFAEIKEYDTPHEHNAVKKAFEASPAISIDYGVMERADNIACIRGQFEWDDIGTWHSLSNHLHTHTTPHEEPQSTDSHLHEQDPIQHLARGRHEDLTMADNPNTEKTAAQNILTEDAPNTLIRTTNKDKKVVAIGLDDYLVVDMDDLLFIAPKGDERKLHQLIEKYTQATGLR